MGGRRGCEQRKRLAGETTVRCFFLLFLWAFSFFSCHGKKVPSVERNFSPSWARGGEGGFNPTGGRCGKGLRFVFVKQTSGGHCYWTGQKPRRGVVRGMDFHNHKDFFAGHPWMNTTLQHKFFCKLNKFVNDLFLADTGGAGQVFFPKATRKTP